MVQVVKGETSKTTDASMLHGCVRSLNTVHGAMDAPCKNKYYFTFS